MYSFVHTLSSGGGVQGVHPRPTPRHRYPGPALLAASMLIDMLGYAQEPLKISAYEGEIENEGKRILTLSREVS